MYFHKDSELFLYLRDMKENVPVIYAAPLQGFTEVAWRNAHAQCLGGVDAYYTPFVRLEKGEIRNKDRRDVSPEENTVSRLVPQVIASEPEELKVLTDFLASQGYRVIEGGEAQLLAKLKTCWEYLLPELDKKQRKAILKSNRLDGYLRAVEEALRG